MTREEYGEVNNETSRTVSQRIPDRHELGRLRRREQQQRGGGRHCSGRADFGQRKRGRCPRDDRFRGAGK
jgi:hypothetical protein